MFDLSIEKFIIFFIKLQDVFPRVAPRNRTNMNILYINKNDIYKSKYKTSSECTRFYWLLLVVYEPRHTQSIKQKVAPMS